MTTATQNNQITIIQNSLDVLKTGPEILQANQERKDKALAVGRNILQLIQDKGMNPELDDRAMKYLANVASATSEMKEQRAGVTQIMDALRKMYTEVENELDVKKDGSIPSQIQLHRNDYAKKLAEEAEKKRLEAEKVAKKNKEAIDLKYTAENSLINGFSKYLGEKKDKLINAFNECTLDGYQDLEGKLKGYTPNYPQQAHQAIPISCNYYLHTDDEATEIFNVVRSEKYAEFKGRYEKLMDDIRNELLEKMPSKLSELKEQKRIADERAAAEEAAKKAEQERQAKIAKAKAEEKAKLEEEARQARMEEEKRQQELKAQEEAALAEQKRREEEESKKRAAEEEEARKKAEQEAAVRKQGEETMVMFEKEAAMAEETSAPEARQGYEIEVLHPVGYTQIFAMWFEHEGKNLPVDKIGNTKLSQMKAWAEKKAHKDGTKIESKFLKYSETFKAVNRKAK